MQKLCGLKEKDVPTSIALQATYILHLNIYARENLGRDSGETSVYFYACT